MQNRVEWKEGLIISLDENRILGKVTNDRFGLYVSNEWKRLIDPYTPRYTGQLMGLLGGSGGVDLLPFQIHYKSTYAKYVYENTRGVKFVTSEQGGSGRNPNATDQWDIKAEQAGQKDKLYRTLNNALISGQF